MYVYVYIYGRYVCLNIELHLPSYQLDIRQRSPPFLYLKALNEYSWSKSFSPLHSLLNARQKVPSFLSL